MIYQFAEHLRKKIKDETELVERSLVAGGAKSFDEYRYMAGTLHGLALAERELESLMDAFSKEQ